ncbi:hypothetical protein Rleg10DRAFT_5784 [Rhizobium leguminosarum bv. trifolii WSM2012]|nr:hypothetical protein Rleg10DRAFT_4202 [Rhizobium leguminosarum bv. trifolii WSM2012]EJC77090.1 hypothetical protein Rleg10DRAFT_5784 [Rhizobium leguminosarum bv. trifolii WSM2012]
MAWEVIDFDVLEDIDKDGHKFSAGIHSGLSYTRAHINSGPEGSVTYRLCLTDSHGLSIEQMQAHSINIDELVSDGRIVPQ